MTTRRDAIASNLCARICDERRSVDELRVVDSVLAGLERGADVYGPLDLATDPRDWQVELAEERRDALIYRSCALLSKRNEPSAPARADVSHGNPQAGGRTFANAPVCSPNGSHRADGGAYGSGCSKCGGGLPCWLAECPVRDARINAGLRELAAAKPQVAAPGVAMEWDMTDLNGDE